ncbi:MAG: tRNA-(ms[2]io[6]A)-hydroxylase [Bacteroidetes bacterium]|nr:tRNA-(ms[2]io[6]A)-hydroxylase [Bacteroidota bacterium]
MFKLKLATDPRWVNIAEENIEEILIDHAYCEQKAASNAISLIILYPEFSDLVESMIEIAQEEMAHFKMVHQLLLQRGMKLGKSRKDEYVNLLLEFMRKGANLNQIMVDRLLFAAMIEARSCERFRILSEKLTDNFLAGFYRDLMISEANHYTTFINFARKYGKEDVDQRWEEILQYEAEIMKRFSVKETIHG